MESHIRIKNIQKIIGFCRGNKFELFSITDEVRKQCNSYGFEYEEGISWVNNKDIELVNKIQKNILDSYESDFSKHIEASEANKVSLIWNGIPSQLARENKKFVYQVVKDGARAREYEGALNWLNDANLIIAIIVIVIFMFISIITDAVGVAITASVEVPFRAMAETILCLVKCQRQILYDIIYMWNCKEKMNV